MDLITNRKVEGGEREEVEEVEDMEDARTRGRSRVLEDGER